MKEVVVPVEDLKPGDVTINGETVTRVEVITENDVRCLPGGIFRGYFPGTVFVYAVYPGVDPADPTAAHDSMKSFSAQYGPGDQEIILVSDDDSRPAYRPSPPIIIDVSSCFTCGAREHLDHVIETMPGIEVWICANGHRREVQMPVDDPYNKFHYSVE